MNYIMQSLYLHAIVRFVWINLRGRSERGKPFTAWPWNEKKRNICPLKLFSIFKIVISTMSARTRKKMCLCVCVDAVQGALNVKPNGNKAAKLVSTAWSISFCFLLFRILHEVWNTNRKKNNTKRNVKGTLSKFYLFTFVSIRQHIFFGVFLFRFFSLPKDTSH